MELTRFSDTELYTLMHALDALGSDEVGQRVRYKLVNYQRAKVEQTGTQYPPPLSFANGEVFCLVNALQRGGVDASLAAPLIQALINHLVDRVSQEAYVAGYNQAVAQIHSN